MRNIKKVFALVIVTTLVFILAACGSKAKIVASAVQGENVVYETQATNLTADDIKDQDFSFFVVYREGKDKFYTQKIDNATASKEKQVTKVSDNLYQVKITVTFGAGKNEEKVSGSYYAILKNETETSTGVLALNLAYYKTQNLTEGTDVEKNEASAKQLNEVQKTLLNLIANPYELVIKEENKDKSEAKYLSVNAILENGTVSAVDLNNTEIDYSKFQNKKEAVSTITLTYGGKEANYNVLTYKPSSNLTPIQTPSKMEYGFFSYIWEFILIIPIGFLMSTFSFGGSLGWGIILATIIVRTIAWPIYAKTNDLSINMSLAQPELDRVKAKYALKKDPASQQKMQMETMKIMKKYKVNILGCFMPLLQMPLFIAMYQVLHRVIVPGGMFTDKIDLGRKFLGFIDLTTGNSIITYVLAALVGASMFFLNKLSTKKPSYAKTTPQAKTDQAKQTEQTMKMVNIIMIVFMVFASISSNSLALYWIIGNLYAIGQSLFNRKRSEKRYAKRKQEII